MKDKCIKCKSEDLTLERGHFINEEDETVLLDHWEAKCNTCGHDFILIDL